MNYLDFYVKTEIILNNNFYYHAFEDEKLNLIYKEGIKCNYFLNKKSNGGYNGRFYVSVCKKNDDSNSAYNTFVNYNYNMFILDSNLKTLKANKNNTLGIYFINTLVPIRTSCYSDEYHVLFKIDSKYIKGIRLSNKSDLIELRNMIINMKKSNIEIPIYDYTHEKDGIIREINKEIILKK